MVERAALHGGPRAALSLATPLSVKPNFLQFSQAVFF